MGPEIQDSWSKFLELVQIVEKSLDFVEVKKFLNSSEEISFERKNYALEG